VAGQLPEASGVVGFPDGSDGVQYLTEGGQETEVMYRHGFELPHFALFTLLDDDDGTNALCTMYAQYLEVAADSGFVPLMGGLDYRNSPDWVRALGRPVTDVRDIELRCIDFLREQAGAAHADRALVTGIVGPRGDAYTVPGVDDPGRGGRVPLAADRRDGGRRCRPRAGDDLRLGRGSSGRLVGRA
jgi:hypothetical protein